MKKIITYSVLGVVLVIGIGIFLYLGGSSVSQVNSSLSTIPSSQQIPLSSSATGVQSQGGIASSSAIKTNPPSTINNTGEKQFTMAQVAQHTTQSSCYTVVNNNVYDVTSFITQHPGGAGRILQMCGVDATNAFMNQHGGQGRPESELASLKIGVLAK